MEMEYHKDYSPALGRDMEIKIYGHGGRPVIFIPCQDGRFYDFENFGMIDHWAPWIDAGKVFVCGIDTIDWETYSSHDDPRKRICRHEDWIRYITLELVPRLADRARQRNGWTGKVGVIAFGCSLGATHAANLYFRFPHLFDSMLALSGIYSTSYGFGDYMDELVYANSPVDYLANISPDHPYMKLYRDRRAVICCGRGAWEEPDTTYRLRDILAWKNIPVWVDFWGYDVNHDWCWWYKQVEYFLPWILGER